MLLSPETLTPKATDVAGVLPPSHVRASNTPDAIEVRRVFPAAIEVSDMLGFTRGYFAMGGAMTLAGLGYFFAATAPDLLGRGREAFGIVQIGLWVLMTFSLPLVFAMYYIFRADTTGYRYEPVLFCRGGAAGPTVHHFAASGVSLIPFKRVHADIRSFPWTCVRGEVTSSVVGAAPFTGRQYMLRLAITDSPNSSRVIERFSVGLVDFGDGSRVVNFWEHLRRYMEEGGPPLSGKGLEGLVPAERMPLWWALLSFMPIGPDADMFGRFRWWKLLFVPAIPFALPFTTFFGVFRWLSLALKKTPQWPAEVLNAAGGGPLSKNEVAEMMKVRPRRTPVIRVNGELVGGPGESSA